VSLKLDREQVKLVALAAAVLALASAMGIFAFQWGRQNSSAAPPPTLIVAAAPVIVTHTPTVTPPPTPTSTPTGTATSTPTPTPLVVISHIESLGRLETAQYMMQTVVNLENEPANVWEQVFGTDKLLLVAEGEVVAGFDLTKVTEDRIKVSGQRVVIDLPAPEILYSRIDNERTQVYERETGLFLQPDPSLESRARQLAEKALVEWAESRGIYQRAAQDGRRQLEDLLRSLGFTEIIINVEGRGI
jgi:hypothetical protein